eukprot:CAMPEP_0197616446 /NCGR_PEP_ID=MMETSP1326-20131121/60530_1 /TAXON_ID=1155430 /ORGANISM="Genus nov. species nov., Strain RCC2288" /LENGTH=346 /DNA_ID=CAMNT_0043185333 /DNA_START=188 /DNA_END=1228 /DNA_ORIENTATION=+
MPRPTRSTRTAAVAEHPSEPAVPASKRAKTAAADAMGCGASSGVAPMSIKSMALSNKQGAKGSKAGLAASSSGVFPRGDSAVDLCVFKGDFDSQKLSMTPSGTPKTLDYRVHFAHKSKSISPWHDIPYRASQSTYHMMCEIPKWSRAKFEVSTKEPNNPVKQDEKKGVLRDYKHGDMLFNYGFMPQTWEDPSHVSEDTGYKGDDDPLDMVEIGCRQMKTGQVAEVKVLGVLAMIDDGETDWKVFCIRVDDPLADLMDDVDDLEREIPGLVDTMREWFRCYKLAEGKPMNAFGLDEKCMDRTYAEKVIEETHKFWKGAQAKLRAIGHPEPVPEHPTPTHHHPLAHAE